MQSVFRPASEGALLIDQLTVALFIGGGVIFAGVMILAARAVWSAPSTIHASRWLLGGGLLLPLVVLAALLVQGLRIGGRLSHDPALRTMEIEVVARRWWWEFRYHDPVDGQRRVVLANELHLPRDCKATLVLVSGDVIHSFWVPALAGKVDMIPGHRNQLVLHATQEGRFRGQCAEFCGTQHANMALEVVVQSPLAFDAWLRNQARPAPAPRDGREQAGQRAFLEAGCGTCHTVRGTSAAGTLGPDLTHVASRRMLGAATLVNDPQALAAWIRGAQHLKPGNLMPSMPVDDESLRAMTLWLGTLR